MGLDEAAEKADLAERIVLSQKNRRIIAERTNWPAGVLETCERFEAAHPGWWVCWMRENKHSWWERPAGFRADWRGYPKRGFFCEDPADLERQITETGLTTELP